MKYFLIEGIVTNPEKMTEKMMQEHQEYTGMLMKEGKVLFSSANVPPNILSAISFLADSVNFTDMWAEVNLYTVTTLSLFMILTLSKYLISIILDFAILLVSLLT